MIRYLIIGAVLYLVGVLVRRVLKQLRQPAESQQTEKSASEATARCAHCGMFVPRNEAVRGDGREFCSREHQQLGTRRDGA
ncbi:uncharacterized protein J2T55_001911 [Methylohalomonas lacus]|uniref:Preprotein translocase subunit YajC n=1 Tax=Methylohalomonas lacus TaxID=398773 RepID=A0AAE3L1D9_9GAMM|nr:PP0621 family protein [Methylohalomonas lacus]MCS3903879.1 uncharacterized protein [Methylohalomonas lacus]